MAATSVCAFASSRDGDADADADAENEAQKSQKKSIKYIDNSKNRSIIDSKR